MGLCFPINRIAALPGSLPSTTPSASMTCHLRSIPFLEGNSVLIDTLSPRILKDHFRLAAYGVRCQICRVVQLSETELHGELVLPLRSHHRRDNSRLLV